MKPSVSVIIPCRNEALFIKTCVDSVFEGGYPEEAMEVLVIDGMSDDGTRDVLRAMMPRHPRLRIVDNPDRSTPRALNIGIRASTGEIILRVDSHSRVAPGYVSRCVAALLESGADNVGGNMVTLPRQPGFIGDSIVAALSHRFGVGNSTFRVNSSKACWVDTVFGGCYRRSTLERLGGFNESLPRSQDIELNSRLRDAGGRIFFSPDIVSYYYALSNIRSFIRHNWTNGIWTILPFRYSRVAPVSWRHLLPMAFVTCVIASLVVSIARREPLWALLVVGPYALASCLATVHVAFGRRQVKYLISMPFVFAALHFPYGAGSLWGGAILIKDWMRTRLRPMDPR